MSLQVNDPWSRGRSSSRTRERSKSRDARSRSRVSSAVPRTSKSSLASLDDNPPRSRSRGPRSNRAPSAVRGHRSKSRPRYDIPDTEGGDGGNASDYYRRGTSRRPRRREYYHSGDEGDDGKEEASYYLKSTPSTGSKFDKKAEETDDSSVDDRLAYGDMPGERKKTNRRSKFWSSLRDSATELAQQAVAAQAAQNKPESPKPNLPPRPGSQPQPEAPGPGYARPEPFKYGYTSPQQHNYPAYPPTSSAMPSNWAPIPECEMPGYVPPSSQSEGQSSMPGAFPPPETSQPASTGPSMPQYANPAPYSSAYVPHSAHHSAHPVYSPTTGVYNPGSYAPAPHTSSGEGPPRPAYANLPPFQYAQIDPSIRYGSKNSSRPFSYPAVPQPSRPPATSPSQHHPAPPPAAPAPPASRPPAASAPPAPAAPTPPPKRPAKPQISVSTQAAPTTSHNHYVEITPGGRTRPSSNSVSSANLTVERPDPSHRPASPLQEPYQGTYQTISPMPSPIVIPARPEDDVSDSETLDPKRSHRRKKSRDGRESKDEGSSRREKSRVRHERHSSTQSLEPDSVVLISPGVSQNKRVSFYNPTPDALAMQEALSHTRHIDHKTLIHILPRLGDEEILDMRKEYKHHVKVHGKGVNVAKHIHLKVGNTPFGKVCYATALGRWESEAYWANCYYQSGSSRRELLIESLMGRRNSEIRAIKESFRDPRYSDSLEKCMKSELKADKFRTAVLLALDERRQSEREPMDEELIDRDVEELHRALISRDGGETAMIFIIVRRSDSHLREVLRTYEKVYRHNFAKAMISKSPNLVVRPPLQTNMHNVHNVY